VKTSDGISWLDQVNAAHSQSKSSTKLASVLKTSLGTRFRPGSAAKHTGFGAFRARSFVVIGSTPTLSTGNPLPGTSVDSFRLMCRAPPGGIMVHDVPRP
jgi:hypothetical protein